MKQGGIVVLVVMLMLDMVIASGPHCSKPVSPRFGGWHATNSVFSVGTVVMFHCLPGYSLVGSRTAICSVGTVHAFWVGGTPRCLRHAVVRCSDPGSPENGRRVLDGTRIGNRVQFSCLDGFELRGSTELVCQHGGRWSGAVPRCVKAIRCPDPGVPMNGRRVMRGDNGGVNVGTIATFSCNLGYRLIGEASIICGSRGRWSRSKPLCRRIGVTCRDPGTPSNGRRQLETLQDGGTVQYSCYNGYRLVGGAKRTCYNGQWTGSLPACIAVNCYNPGTPHNGFSHFQSTALNAKVTYSCRTGFVLQGASSRTCQSNGLWSGNLPLCIRIDCGHPENIANGVKSLSDGTLLNSVVTYYCNTGYALRGSKTRQCASNRRWTGSAPECVAIVNCGQPQAPSNGGVNADRTTLGARAVYYCKQGFTLSGETERLCKPNGRWSGSVPFCRIVDCGNPRTPRNGERDLSSTMFRSVVQYSCSKGYNLVGDKVRICLASGKWSGLLPTCKLIDCGDPGTPQNGKRKVTSTAFRSAVHYSCNSGFSLVGDQVRICMASGEWSGFIPACKKQLINCGNPGVPINGHSDYRDDKIGSVVTHSCVSGFELRGDRQRRCLPSGKWSGSLPICQSTVTISCGDAGTVANGNVITTDNTVGSKATIKCDDGFQLNGNSERICEPNGHWSGVLPTCEAVNCGDPGTLNNGWRDLSGTTYRNTVVYYCDNGFTLEGNSLRSCQKNGQWSGRIPECRKPVVNCGQPEVIAFGSVETVSTTVDSVAVYTCENGYQLKGTSVRTCLLSGVWSATPPVCIIIDCGLPEVLEGGFVHVTSTTFDSEAIYTCNPGHFLVGDRVRLCGITGTWLGTVPTCQPVSCSDPGTPANGMRRLAQGTLVGSFVTYECDKGYMLEGSSSRVCQPDGVWSATLPSCKALSCGDPGTPSNGRKIITTHTIGSEVLFTCEPGYSLDGNNVRICQPDQTWSGSIPRCILVDCGDPGLPPNAARTFSQTVFNSVVMYTCNVNYMLSGEALRICQADGTWSGTLPTCEAKELMMCNDPGLPEHGKRTVASNLVTAVVTFSCDLGYFMVGNNQRTCLPTGQWSGSVPSCELIDCGIPDKPSNGIVIGNDFTFGATVEYECTKGFVLVGPKTRTCQDNGLWSRDTPFCKESALAQCDDPGVPENGRRIGNNLEIGSVVYFQCFDGYELVGETSIVCLPGAVWSARGPFCRIINDMCNGDGNEVFDSCDRKCTCRGGVTTECCRFRRDWASMSIADRRQYIDAVIKVSTHPLYKPRYDSLISQYQLLSDSLVHNSDPSVSQFIPWHRYFLLEYENLLRQISCNITIPYWDWTGLAKNPYAADVFEIDSGFGDSARFNDSCVNIGPFSADKWALPDVVGGGCLKRQYQFRNFPTRDYIERDLLPKPASEFIVIHRSLQLVVHNQVRCTIGGTMCTAGDSAAADPLYILHLSRIDSIYSHWQDLKMGRQLVRYADDTTFLASTNSLTVAELSDIKFLPYRTAVCYDTPFELKNFQPTHPIEIIDL